MFRRRLNCKIRSLRARFGIGRPRSSWDGHCWKGFAPIAMIYPRGGVRCVDCQKVEEPS